MGNEDKISGREIVKRGSAFLPDEIRDYDGQSEVYSLESEFAKTKKNRNYKLFLFIFIFIVATAGLTYLYSLYLASESRNINVDIQEFEDMRLKEFLQSARHDESNIDILRINLQVLQVEMLDSILDVRRDFLSKQIEISEQPISQEEKNSRISDLKGQEEKSVKAVEAGYRARIAGKRREIWALEAQINKAKSSIKSDLLANEDKIYKLRMEKLRKTQQSGIDAIREYYENYVNFLTLKYNPVFRSARHKSAISGENGVIGDLELKEYSTIMDREAGFNSERFSNLREHIADNLLLINRLVNIPYINSVAPALKRVDGLTKSIIQDYEMLWSRLVGALSSRNAQLRGYNYAFSQQMEKIKENNRPETGFILDPRNEKGVIVYLLDEKAVKGGDAALVLRGNDEYVGTIELYRSSGIVRGRVLEKKADMQPFDILVRVIPDNRKEQKK